MEKPISFSSMFKDNTSKKTVHLYDLRNDKCVSGADVSIPLASVDEVSSTYVLVDSIIVVISFQNRLGHCLETVVIEYEWKSPHCDTCLAKSDIIESIVNDSDNEEVKNVFVEDKENPWMD
ncbi:hypothetical protein Tco_0778733 [Tanacetum coccineum]